MLPVVFYSVNWRSPECSEWVSCDCSILYIRHQSLNVQSLIISIPGYNYTMKTTESPKQLCEKVGETCKSGDGYKNISKSLNIPQSSVNSISKKWEEYGPCVKLLRAGRPHKLSNYARPPSSTLCPSAECSCL